MPTITFNEKRLEEIIEKNVRKLLKTNLDDVEEVRRSPAGAIVRIETRLDAIEKNMATKADLATLKTELSERIANSEKNLSERLDHQSERIAKVETSLKLILAMLLPMLALLIKSVFFS